jgi:hypothetical protein
MAMIRKLLIVGICIGWLVALAFGQSGLNINSALYQAWAFRAQSASVATQTNYDFLVYTNLGSTSSTTDGTNFTISAYTPFTNALLLATVITGRTNGTAPQPTVTGNGVTWDLVTNCFYQGPTNTIYVFRAMGSPTNGTLTIGYPSNATAMAASVDMFTGADTSGVNGSGAIVTARTNAGATATPTITMSTPSLPWTNAWFAAVGDNVNSATDCNRHTNGMSEILEIAVNTPPLGMCNFVGMCIPDYQSTFTCQKSTARSWGVVLVEIKPRQLVIPTTEYFTNFATMFLTAQGETNGNFLDHNARRAAVMLGGDTSNTAVNAATNTISIQASAFPRRNRPVRLGDAEGTVIAPTNDTHSIHISHNVSQNTIDWATGIKSYYASAVISFYIKYAPANAGAGSQFIDYLGVYEADTGNYVMHQLDPGTAQLGLNYAVNQESSNPTTHGNTNTVTENGTYWVTYKADFASGRGWLRMYDTNLTVLYTGTNIVNPDISASKLGGELDKIKFGNNEIGSSSGRTSIVENVLVDFRTGRWPVLP